MHGITTIKIPKKLESTLFFRFVIVLSNVAQYDHITLFYKISGQLFIFLAGRNEEFVLSMKKVTDTSTGALTECFDER
jgi:hypothetical protein